MSIYQPGIPTGIVNLDVDYQNIQDNFQQLDTSFGVDHVTFSNQTAQNGYHEEIHFNPFSTTTTNPPNNQPAVIPTAISGYGQMFNCEINDGINTDTSLMFLTGGNRLMQMTRNFAPVAANNGYTFLPGGIIMLWGIRGAAATTSVAVLFATAHINFPNACFNVNVVPIRSTNSPGNDYATAILTGSVSKTGFTIANIGGHSGAGWYWTAIGN